MSALGMYASLALICVSSAIVGQGVRAALSSRKWSWISPAVGLAAMLVLGGLAIRLPGRGTTASLALVLVIAASLVVLLRRGVQAPGVIRVGGAVAVVVVVAASLPFTARGAFGVLGPDVNQDLAAHLVNAEWLRSHEGVEPEQIASGYPIGPHGLAVTVSELTGVGLRESFTAMLIAGAVATALASLAVLRGLAPGRRMLACLLVGLPYLAASFYVQSAFKETLMGMLVLAFALGLREAAGEEGTREEGTRDSATGGAAFAAGVPLGLLAAAAVQTYSYPGLSWLAATVGLWALAWLAFARPIDRRSWRTRLSALVPAAGVATAVLAIATVADLPRILDFSQAGESTFAGTAVANLVTPVPPYEALGIWLSSDYRLEPSNVLHAGMLAAAGLLALALGILRLARRRELALLAGVASLAAAYMSTRLLLGIYAQSKALAIASPLIMLTALYGVLDPARPPHGRVGGSLRLRVAAATRRLRDLARSALRGNAAPLGRVALALAFVIGSLASTYLALAGAKVDRGDNADALARLRAELDGEAVLFLGSDVFAATELHGLSVQGFPAGPLKQRDARPTSLFDFDTFVPGVLDAAGFVITGRTLYGSEPPSNFHRIRSPGPFVLWERTGPAPSRRTLNERHGPGAVLDCSTPGGRRLSRRDGIARVFDPRPVHGPVSAWADTAGAAVSFPQAAEDRPATQQLRLTPGRWQISLQYSSAEPLVIRAPGFDVEQPPRLDFLGAYVSIGTIQVAREEPVPFTVEVARRPFLRRALGAPTPDPAATLGAIVATPVAGDGRSTIPLREACGQLVDWYRIR